MRDQFLWFSGLLGIQKRFPRFTINWGPSKLARGRSREIEGRPLHFYREAFRFSEQLLV